MSTTITIDPLYSALFEAFPGNCALLAIDFPKFTVLAATPGYFIISNTTKETLIGRGLFESFPQNPNDPKDTGLQDSLNSCYRVITNKEPHTLPVQRYDIRTAEGDDFTVKYWSITNKPVCDSNGDVLYIIHSAEDITSTILSQQQEEKIKGLEKAYNLFMQVPAVIGITKGAENILVLANESALQLWGKTSDIIGKPLSDTIPELRQQGIINLFDEVRKSGKPYSAKEVAISTFRSGVEEVRYFDLIYQPYFDEDVNQAAGIFTLSYDVTEIVIAKRKVEASELKYRTLFESIDQGFCILDIIFDNNNDVIDFRYVEVNPAFTSQSGLAGVVGKTILELVPDFEPEWFKIYEKVIRIGEPIRFIEESKAFGKWFHVYAFRIGGADSNKVAALFTDITSQKKAEKEIRESEERFRQLADDSPMFVFIISPDPEAPVSYWNKTWLEYTGQTLEEAIGRAWNGIIHPDDIPVVMEYYVPAFQKNESYFIPAVRVKRHDGEYRWHAFKGNPRYFPDGGFNGYVGVGFDIHEQKLAEEAIKQSEAQLQIKVAERTQELESQKNLFDNILKNSSNGISVSKMLRDETGKIIDARTIMANDAALRFIGLPREIYLGKSAVELDANIMDTAYAQSCIKTLETGEPALSQYYQEMNQRWQEVTISKLDQDHLIHIFTDITPVKQAQLQLERTVEELKRSNNYLEEFAYAASHDLKEPIRKIRTFSDRLKNNLQGKLSETEEHYFDRMEKATHRMRILIEDLLEYSHISNESAFSDEIDLNKKVSQVLEDLEVEVAEKQAEVIVGPLPVIKGHRRQMLQLFQNLVTNALKFRKPGVNPVIEISSSIVIGENTGLNLPDEFKLKNYHLIKVADNGIGFDQEYADTIFKMFQRLHGKAEYEGTGIGLAIVRKVVENHNGFIKAEGKPGLGATFKIFLPIE